MEKRSILVLGTGRSASALIDYLLNRAEQEHWYIIAGSLSAEVHDVRFHGGRGEVVQFDSSEEASTQALVRRANVVISMLPPDMHPLIARLCLVEGKHLFTASYVSDAMQALHAEAKAKGLLFMNECGLDPGLDHMTAMQVLDHIRASGGEIISFESFTGGLIAPSVAPDNPWRYKFTWNPAGVVKAGQGVAKWLSEGRRKHIPYWRLFTQLTPVSLGGEWGNFVGYANRDSLKYLQLYGLENIQTMIRGTLRSPNFCNAWNVFVQLGCTDDTYEMPGLAAMTHRDFMGAFLPPSKNGNMAKEVAHLMKLDPEGDALQCLKWSGCFTDELIGLEEGTPAQALEHLLKKRWALETGEIDMAVMWHRCIYTLKGQHREMQTRIAYMGDPGGYTAMAKGVGLPLAIAVRLLLSGKISLRGVHIPVDQSLYTPVLEELAQFGIRVEEQDAPCAAG